MSNGQARGDYVLNVDDVAALLGIHGNTVKRIPPEELPYFRVGSRGDRRYDGKDVRAYILSKTVTRGAKKKMIRDDILERIAEFPGLDEEELVLFDGMEDAFVGVAERFEEGGHRYFLVYSYEKMVAILTDGDVMSDEDAREYLEFNTVGLYAGPGTPAILRD